MPLTSGAAFLARFGTAYSSYEWIDSLDRDVQSRTSLIDELSSKVHGMSFALTCDFVKELGHLGFCKPDVHLKEIFTALDLCTAKGDRQVFKAIARVAENVGVAPYHVDRVFWPAGSGDFYLNGIQVGRHRGEFIKYAQRELCDDLPG